MSVASPPRRTQAERSARSDKRMLEAAIRLMVERGYKKTTLVAIGEAAGYSRGLVTHRFGSKAGLFEEAMRWISRRWRDHLSPYVDGRDGVEALAAFLHAHRSFAEESPETMRALFALWFEAISPDSEMLAGVREDHRRLGSRIRAWIESGMEAGTIRADVNPGLATAQFLGALFGLTYQWLADPDRRRLRELLAGLDANTRRVLAAP